MKNIVLFIASAFAAVEFYACQETDAVFYDEPRVRMVLYNARLLSEITTDIKVIDTALAVVKKDLTKIDSVKQVKLDSVILLDKQIKADSVGLETLFLDVKAAYNLLELAYEDKKKVQKNLNEDRVIKKKIETTINSGSMHLSSITNLRNNHPEIYEDSRDSANSWPLPLDMNRDSVKLALEISGVKYLLGMTYDRSTILDDLSRFTVESSSLRLINYEDAEYEETGTIKFDSVKLKCKTQECIDNEASIAIYF